MKFAAVAEATACNAPARDTETDAAERDAAEADLAEADHTEMELDDGDVFDELPLPYLQMDASGMITRANRASLELHPAERGKLIGRTAWDMLAADEKDQSFAAYRSALESGEAPPVVRHSLYDRTGRFRTYEMHRNLVRDAEGNPAGMRMLCVDVTEAKEALESARRSSLRLENVMDSLCEAMVVTDAVGSILSANPAAELLLGWRADELKVMSIEEGVPIVAYLSGDYSELTFAMALAGQTKGIATILDRKGREVNVGISTSPIVDKESGSTTGVALLLRKLEIPE